MLSTLSVEPTTAQEQAPSDRHGTQSLSQNDEHAVEPEDEHAHDETPALGVIVSTCPGDAVCVHGTIWGSPAQQADIREGDYILSINQQPVKSPQELQAAVREVDAEQKVKLVLWRQGKEIAKEISLALAAEEIPKGHAAWLGVQLKEGQGGVTLARVVRGSPADQAGLDEGDVVTKLNGKAIEDIEVFVETIGDLGSGSELQLTIRRDGQDKTVTAQLGSIDEAPLAYLRHAFAVPQWEGQSATSQQPDEMIDLTLDALREEMRELRRQVEALTEGKSNPAANGNQDNNDNQENNDNQDNNERDLDQQRQQRKIQPQNDNRGSASLDVEAEFNRDIASCTQFVMQRGQNRGPGNWDSRNQRNRNWYNDYSHNNRLMYPPVYRSPYYGNSYFRNGGQNYYYGNPNYRYGYGGYSGYGRGTGLRVSPNLGFYWY